MDSQNKAQDLASMILSSSSPQQISAVCSAIESFLQNHVADQSRSFFSIAFPCLICKIFGFDDSSSQKSRSSNGWIDQIQAANDSDLAGRVFNLLSPSGILLSSIFSVDRHSLVKYVFPIERLPEWARVLLQNESDSRVLSDLCPLFKGRVKEDQIQGSYQVQLNVFEYYMFWFAYYPVCKGNNENSKEVVVRKNRRFRLENWTTSLPVLASAKGSGHRMECRLYLRLLYGYVHAFVPSYGFNTTCQPYRSSLLHCSSGHDGSVLFVAEFVVYTLMHFWLVDNDFSPYPMNVCRSFGVSFPFLPFRTVVGETPPTAGLGDVVKLLVKYLNKSSVVTNEELDPPDYSQMPRWSASGSVDIIKSRSAVPMSYSGNYGSSWNSLIQRPVYRFILRTFLFCPMGTSINNASQVFSAWISFMEPWKISLEDFAEFDALQDRSRENLRYRNAQSQVKKNAIKDGSQVECVYTPSWEGYVVSNYLFYSSLVIHFLGFAHKFLHANAEAIIQMVLKMLNILTSSRELMDLLKKVDSAYHSKPAGSFSPMFDSSYKCVSSIREQLQDWEDGLCESDADGSFLHENWNRELKLFGDGEDGGRQLLQLLILRAEPEIRAISGDNLAQNLQTLDSLKAQMGLLFNGAATEKPKLAIPEVVHVQNGRQEVFTPKHPGIGKRTWADIKYKGDWMRRPISEGEVAWLARIFIRLSDWLNETLGLDHRETSIHAVPDSPYVDLPPAGDDMGRVVGLKEAVSILLSFIWSRLLFLGQVVVKFMRGHGMRINLRVLASKKVVMVLVAYALFCALKKLFRATSHFPAVWASLLW
ncbi:sphingomyelin phosphodiesterase [Tasmannia lanceolata]|uniref:sphingomyelin phosphodiesterase n=1 Tax=Tasmannia lanceolata TaxID=3420 RepID=UPI004062A718